LFALLLLIFAPVLATSHQAQLTYADFRTGRNLFSRGALMAAEMDERIRGRSAGKKGFRDGMRNVMTWSVRNRMPLNNRGSVSARFKV